MAIMDERDCCFERGKNWFRYRVGAIILRDGKVLLAKNDKADYYYSVGGGVHHGEAAGQAIVREVYEETGVRFDIDRLAVVHENFFSHDTAFIRGMDCHELSLYFLMKPNPADIEHCRPEVFGNQYVEWVPVEKLPHIKAFPLFLHDYLKDIPDGVAHIVTHDDE